MYETISYTVVCNDLCEVIKGEKFFLDVKRAVQADIMKQASDSKKVSAHSKMVDIPSRVTPSMMMSAQEEDIDMSKMIHYVKSGNKPSLAQIHKIKSRSVYRYLWQFD